MAQHSPPPLVTPNLAAIRDRAKSLHGQGKLFEALDAHDEALRLAPAAIGILVSAGRLAHDLGLQERSLGYFDQALRLDPNCFPAIDCARMICVGAGLYERASMLTTRAHAIKPSDTADMALALCIPAIAHSVDDIRVTRARYERALDALLASSLHLEVPDGLLGASAFFLAYHGQNDRKLQSQTARMFLKVIPALEMTAAHCDTEREPSGRIRVGFLSRFFYDHSIFSTSVGLIEQLTRPRFEVFALRITPSRDDEATARIRRAADHTVDLHPDFFRAREQIAALELDILFFQDVGMDPTSYFLSFARLAPVQCVSFGHPNTTGVPTMDYFISSDAFEPADAELHYSEKLIELRDLPTLAYYYRPSYEAAPIGREALGLPADGHLYLCPQTLYKLHPDFDELLRGLLQRDPQAVVVLIRGQFPEFSAQLEQRITRSLEGLAGRILFIPRMPFSRFMDLLRTAHVVLDTIHFNGMNSSLEAFAVGTPVVTLPSGLQRGRHTQAMYIKMQITECIARSPEEYVQIAVHLGTDPTYAAGVRAKILSRNHVLYEDRRVVEEFERFFIEAHAEKSASSLLAAAAQHRGGGAAPAPATEPVC